MSKLSANIKDFRLLRGLSQRELAEKIHKSPNAVANWERNINSPDVDTLESLCEILNVTPNEIYGWEVNSELADYILQREKLFVERQNLIDQKAELEKRIDAYNRKINRKQ